MFTYFATGQLRCTQMSSNVPTASFSVVGRGVCGTLESRLLKRSIFASKPEMVFVVVKIINFIRMHCAVLYVPFAVYLLMRFALASCLASRFDRPEPWANKPNASTTNVNIFGSLSCGMLSYIGTCPCSWMQSSCKTLTGVFSDICFSGFCD